MRGRVQAESSPHESQGVVERSQLCEATTADQARSASERMAEGGGRG